MYSTRSVSQSILRCSELDHIQAVAGGLSSPSCIRLLLYEFVKDVCGPEFSTSTLKLEGGGEYRNEACSGLDFKSLPSFLVPNLVDLTLSVVRCIYDNRDQSLQYTFICSVKDN